jgi:acyl-CoA synthetase (AMP-forming)/AMP-acid ligase II
MGLIGCMLAPTFQGITMTFMSPLSFVMKPLRWLQAISKFGGTVTGAPNFAYDLCVKKVEDKDQAGLDLSSWKVAVNGAEPIRAETLRTFTEKFGPCGFSNSTHYPCYGMAESTLIITIIIGDSLTTPRVSEELFHRGINAQPILHPAVAEKEARIRFFITALHTPEQIKNLTLVILKPIHLTGKVRILFGASYLACLLEASLTACSLAS